MNKRQKARKARARRRQATSPADGHPRRAVSIQGAGSIRTSIPRPQTNTRYAVTLVPEFPPTSPQATTLRPPGGLPGDYRVTFILTTGPAPFAPNIDLSRMTEMGASLLACPPGVTEVKVTLRRDTPGHTVHFYRGADGTLARAEVTVSGADFREAIAEAHDVVIPILSYWSYRHNVAIGVAGYHTEELRSGVLRVQFGFLGRVQELTTTAEEQARSSSPETRLVLSAYREGLTAGDLFYAVLSFARAIEGVRRLRTRRRKRLLAAGQEYRDPGERFPGSLAELTGVNELQRESFASYLSRKFTDIMDNELRGPIRNALAHLDPSDDVLSADRWADLTRCEDALPVLQYIAREMIGHELEAERAASNGATTQEAEI